MPPRAWRWCSGGGTGHPGGAAAPRTASIAVVAVSRKVTAEGQPAARGGRGGHARKRQAWDARRQRGRERTGWGLKRMPRARRNMQQRKRHQRQRKMLNARDAGLTTSIEKG